MRGQTTLAYLVMLAAILTIAVTAVVIFQSMLSPAEAANIVLDDKYQASILGIELVDYTSPYQGSVLTAPNAVVYNQEPRKVVLYDDFPGKHGVRVMDIGANKLFGKFTMNDNGSVIKLQSIYSKFKEAGINSADLQQQQKDTGNSQSTESEQGVNRLAEVTICMDGSTGLLRDDLGITPESGIDEIARAYAIVYSACGVSPSEIKDPVRAMLTSTGWTDGISWLKTVPQDLVDKISPTQTAN